MEEARQHSSLGGGRLQSAFSFLLWASLVALAATFVGWLIDRQLGFYAFCVFLALLIARSVIVVGEGILFGSVHYGARQFDRRIHPAAFWGVFFLNSVVVLMVGVVIAAKLP